jgi:D-alanyl-D-alanine carboxypeptidase (penicillin-binding protein 5/6)
MTRLITSAALFLITSSSFSLASAATVIAAPPELDNKAFIVMDYDSGQVLAQKNQTQHLAPASMTKMMTSFIIEQKLLKGELTENEKVRMNESAWCRGSSSESCMYVPLNGTATVVEMLRGIIVQSGNDASKAMAEHISGSEGTFAHLMNQEAQRLGLKDTHFENATGMPSAQHYSSALDLANLARHIIHDSAKYYPIYAEKEFSFNGIKQGNRNALLYTDPSVDGLKTGHTNEAGFCMTTSSKRGPMRLITVIFGAQSAQARADQSRQLLNWGFANFETVNIRPAQQALATAPVWFGLSDKAEIGVAEPFSVTLPKGQSSQISTKVDVQPKLEAPLKQGQVVGKISALLDGKVISESPLIVLKPVEEAGFFARLLDHIKLFFINLF